MTTMYIVNNAGWIMAYAEIDGAYCVDTMMAGLLKGLTNQSRAVKRLRLDAIAMAAHMRAEELTAIDDGRIMARAFEQALRKNKLRLRWIES